MDFWTPANVVFPLLIIMVIGYVLKQLRMLDESTITKMNRVCFHAFIPTMMFVNLYQADLSLITDMSYIIYGVACVAIICVLSILIIPRIIKENSKRGVLIQGMYRSNFVLLGITICNALYGIGNTSATAILIAVVVPIYNGVAVIILNMYSDKQKSFVSTVIDVFKNPVIIAAILGLGVNWMGFQLPKMIDTVVTSISTAAVPLALVLLGGFFTFDFKPKEIKLVGWSVFIKLVAIPIVFMIPSILLGYRGVELATLMVMFAAPAGVTIFPMSQAMGGDGRLACQLIVSTSILSVFTIFFWIAILNGWGFL